MNTLKTISLLLTLSCLIILSSCEKTDTFLDSGYYTGSFSYQGEVKFNAIVFYNNTYQEVPSGGAANQKFPCVTKGTYKIMDNTITFLPTVMPDCLCFECLLNGDYTLVQSGSKLIFKKGTGNTLQNYDLTLTASPK